MNSFLASAKTQHHANLAQVVWSTLKNADNVCLTVCVILNHKPFSPLFEACLQLKYNTSLAHGVQAKKNKVRFFYNIQELDLEKDKLALMLFFCQNSILSK